MNTRIGGLTPREHFQLHGSLPTDAIERMLDQLDLMTDFVAVVAEISPDLTTQAYSNPVAFDLGRIQTLLKILREIRK